MLCNTNGKFTVKVEWRSLAAYLLQPLGKVQRAHTRKSFRISFLFSSVLIKFKPQKTALLFLFSFLFLCPIFLFFFPRIKWRQRRDWESSFLGLERAWNQYCSSAGSYSVCVCVWTRVRKKLFPFAQDWIRLILTLLKWRTDCPLDWAVPRDKLGKLSGLKGDLVRAANSPHGYIYGGIQSRILERTAGRVGSLFLFARSITRVDSLYCTRDLRLIQYYFKGGD